jgi:hypothetical protein
LLLQYSTNADSLIPLSLFSSERMELYTLVCWRDQKHIRYLYYYYYIIIILRYIVHYQAILWNVFVSVWLFNAIDRFNPYFAQHYPYVFAAHN